METGMTSGKQIKAARELLGWSIYDLASRSGVGRHAIERFETDGRPPEAMYVAQIEAALSRGGIEFSSMEIKLKRSRGTWDDPSKE